MFKDSSDVSVKRVIAFFGFLFLGITMLVNSFTSKEIAPADNLVEAVKFIVAFCVGGNVVEKFKNSFGGSSTSNPSTPDSPIQN